MSVKHFHRDVKVIITLTAITKEFYTLHNFLFYLSPPEYSMATLVSLPLSPALLTPLIVSFFAFLFVDLIHVQPFFFSLPLCLTIFFFMIIHDYFLLIIFLLIKINSTPTTTFGFRN